MTEPSEPAQARATIEVNFDGTDQDKNTVKLNGEILGGVTKDVS